MSSAKNVSQIAEEFDKAIEPFYRAHKRSIDRRNASIRKMIAEKSELAQQCKQRADELYQQLMEILPEEHKELLGSYSLLQSAQRDLQNAYATKKTITFYRWALKRARKHNQPTTSRARSKG